MCKAQVDFITDRSDWAIACCGKQAGKNFTVVRLMLFVAADKPLSNVIYVNSTYREARAIMWADGVDGLPAVARELGLKFEMNESRLELTLSNGSQITLMGADRGAWDKLLGQKIDLLVADELQKMDDVGLEKAIRQTIPDRFAARKGMFRGIGTPNEFCVGVFHDIATSARYPKDHEKEGQLLYPAFRVHRWTAKDLDGKTPVWQEQLRWKQENNISDDDPIWLRDKLGLWVPQDNKLMLPLYPASFWDGQLPPTVTARNGSQIPRRQPTVNYAGLDFGFTDSAAFVVGCTSPEEPKLREVFSWKMPGLDNEQLFNAVKDLIREHNVLRVFADSADPAAIALFQRKGLPVYPADKHGKTGYIQDMRGHLRTGQLQILEGGPLHTEIKTLAPCPIKWRQRKLEPVPGSEDHCFDAFRYLYRGVWEQTIKVPQAPLSKEEESAERIRRIAEESLGIGPKQRRGNYR